MIYRRFYIPFLLVLPIIIIISCSLSFAQYNTYPTYQTSSYWPNLTGSYIDPYSQTIPYSGSQGNYLPSLTNPYNPYGTVYPYGYSSLNTGNFYNYDPFGYAYTSPLLNSFAFPLTLAGAYNPQISPTNTTTGGTTSTAGTSGTNGTYYTAQAASFYPTILQGLTSPYQINPYALSTISLSSAYLNPFGNYLPNQSYYQNPYISYPYNYNIGQVNPYQTPYVYTNPYTGNTINPYTQPTSYTQPLPYYQTNSTTASSEANLVNVNGTWAGTWFTTLADGTVNSGDVTMSLTQNAAVISGSISFSMNSYQKLSTSLNGTITGTSLTLTGALMNGVEFYTLFVQGNISGGNLSGTYSINTNSGSIIESGTYSVAPL